MIKRTLLIAAATVALAGAAEARDQINIVGYSTVYPFSTVVAEKFGKSGTTLTSDSPVSKCELRLDVEYRRQHPLDSNPSL